MTINKALRYTVLGGLFLIPFIPFIVTDTLFFPFITGKNFTFRIIIEIISGAWLILALRDQTYLPKCSWILKIFLLFLATMFISDLLSPNMYKSFWSNYERMEGYVTLLHLFALFVVASSVLTKKIWGYLLQTSIVASVIVAIYGLFQLGGKLDIHQGGVRLDATFGNATYLAIYLVFHVFLSLLLLYRSRLTSVRVGYLAVIALELFVLYHTATRGAVLGLLGGLFLSALLVAILERKAPVLRNTALGVLIGLTAVVGAFFIARNTDFVRTSPVLSRFAGISVDDKTTESRFLIWHMAWQGVKDRPFFGWGQESFNYVFNTYYDPRMFDQEQWFDRAHDIFFDWLVAGGILGFLGYFGLFGAALYYLWRKKSDFSIVEKSIFTGLFVGYIFNNIFVFDNITSYILFIFVLAYIHDAAGIISEKLKAKVQTLDRGAVNRILSPLTGVLVIFLVYFVNMPALFAASDLIQALASHPGSPAENLTYYKEALAWHSLGDSEIREQLSQSTSQAVSLTGLDPNVKQSFFNLAQSEMSLQLLRTPKDARYEIFMGTLLDRAGQFGVALEHLEKAHALSPNKQTIMFELATAYLNAKQPEKALETMKTAYDLDPSFEQVKIVYALIAIYAKQSDLANGLLATIDPKDYFGDERFTAAFISTGEYSKALQGINYLLQIHPSNVQYYLTLAAIDLQIGKRVQATDAIQKAVDLNPSFKDQGAYYIKEIKAGRNP